MLHYELTKPYIDFVSSLPFKERGQVLWNSQAILSTASGYLRMKVADIDEERSIFRVAENTYLLVCLNYSFVRLIDGAKTKESPTFKNMDVEPLISPTIKELVAKDNVPFPQDELQAILEKNYFTPWFIKLFSFLPKEDRDSLSKKEVQVETKTKENEALPAKEEAKEEQPRIEEVAPKAKEVKTIDPLEVRKPKVKIASFPTPDFSKKEESAPKAKPKAQRPVDGAEYEKAILLELQKAYESRLSKKKTMSAPKLKHVRFAPKEFVISYDSKNSCLDLLLRRTRQNGCRLSNDNWLILLANTVDESFAREIESRYPDHVLYTDNQNKGKIDIAFIVKKNRNVEEANDDLGIKRVKSKVASFNKEMPTGAYENIDEDEIDDRPHSSYIRPVKSKVATFAPILPENSNDADDEFDFQIDEDGFFFDALDEDISGDDYAITEDIPSEEENVKPEVAYPKHWHCYLCGKKKLYSGEPAEITKLGNGNTIYLCKKHRGKI